MASRKNQLDPPPPFQSQPVGGGIHGPSSLPSPSWALRSGWQGRRPSLGGPGWGWWEGAFNLKRGNRRWHGREAGAGENPLGRHLEWLISADESLFSFCLNTLNRAPSDVYLHSLRANVGGRAQGSSRGRATPGLGASRKLQASFAVGRVVERGVWCFSDPAHLEDAAPSPGAKRKGGASTFLCSGTR